MARSFGVRPDGFYRLTLGSLGVVYGDIGTSPLYAFKESVSAASKSGVPVADAVLGIVSLILWALLIIVTAKYVLIILRADNHGEGGTLTLMALVQRVMPNAIFIPILGMIGAALFYGDAVITPAISVLSAVEGLELVTPTLGQYVLPISLVILVGLFIIQSRGTGSIGAWFGPIMGIWFVVIAVGGLINLTSNWTILAALNPYYAVSFLVTHGAASLLTLGAVFLAVTGAEALYADLGHFGRKPIEIAWNVFVLPALALNYLGQGALVLNDPGKIENPFYLLYPEWALLPMVALATVATIIASQAVISGTYSMTQQAIQLGLLPRMHIDRTSETEHGQIYIGRINWLLLVAVLLLVGIFKNSSALAAAYGVSVTGTMVVSAILVFFVVWKCWNWTPWRAALLIGPFLIIDFVFLGANLLKVFEGGWIPLAIGTSLFVVMLTWRRGARLLNAQTLRDEIPLRSFIQSLERHPPSRVSGTAVFLTGHANTVPTALLHNLKHNKVLHEQNVILSIQTEDRPRVSLSERATVERLSENFSRITLHFGYMERPDIASALPLCKQLGWQFEIMQTSFFLSRRALRTSERSIMPNWQDNLFVQLAHSAGDAARYFGIPTSRLVEVGTQISI